MGRTFGTGSTPPRLTGGRWGVPGGFCGSGGGRRGKYKTKRQHKPVGNNLRHQSWGKGRTEIKGCAGGLGAWAVQHGRKAGPCLARARAGCLQANRAGMPAKSRKKRPKGGPTRIVRKMDYENSRAGGWKKTSRRELTIQPWGDLSNRIGAPAFDRGLPRKRTKRRSWI